MTPSKQVFWYIGVYTLSYPSLQRFDTTNVVYQMIRRRFPDGPSWELLLQSLNTTPVMTSASRSDPLNLRQCCSALFTSLSTIERMLVRDKRPRILAVLSRAVANVDSIGWVVRIQCPAGKAWNASSPSWSFSRHAAAFGYFGAYERHEMIEGLICRLAPPSRSPEFDSSRVQTNRLHRGYTPHSWIGAGIPTGPDFSWWANRHAGFRDFRAGACAPGARAMPRPDPLVRAFSRTPGFRRCPLPRPLVHG